MAKTESPDRSIRDQEVLRANRELAAYFRGLRTEREARGALKIIKAFIRDRERTEPGKRGPLPGAKSAAPSPPARKRLVRRPKKRRRSAAVAETATSPEPIATIDD